MVEMAALETMAAAYATHAGPVAHAADVTSTKPSHVNSAEATTTEAATAMTAPATPMTTAASTTSMHQRQ